MRFLPLILPLAVALASASADEFRALSFNIRYDRPDPGAQAWTERRDTVAKIIRENADLAGLQEVLPQQRRDLAERCADFVMIGIGREPNDRGEASPILYRRDRFDALESGTFWFSDTPEMVGSKSWGNDIPRICTWAKLQDRKGGAPFWYFNLHLDHRSQPSRERSAALLLERVKARAGEDAVLIGGDFNAAPDNEAIRLLARSPSPFSTVYEIAGIPAEGTFHDFTGQAGKGAIDYFFVDPKKWKVSGTEVVKISFTASDGSKAWPSDHFPLKTVLELQAR